MSQLSRDKRNHPQGHVTSTNKVTLHSYSVDLYLFDIRDPKNLRNKKKDNCSSVTSTSVRKGHAQGHVTLTYKVTLDSYRVDLYSFDIRDPKNLRNKKKDNCSSVTSTRFRKSHAQGHVTLTYKVTLDSYSVDLYLFDIRDPKSLRNKKKIIALASLVPELGKVTLRVTWPWHTRSRVIVAVWNYIFLTSLALKTCKTKKNHRSGVIRIRDMKGNV